MSHSINDLRVAPSTSSPGARFAKDAANRTSKKIDSSRLKQEVDESMKRTLLTLAVLLGLALPVAAQLATGNIYGIATDESGAPLPGVAVSVKGAAGTINTVSGSDGRFRFLNLPPGSYK